LSDADSIRRSFGENRIQFRLHNQRDFDGFEVAVVQLADAEWTGAASWPVRGPEIR
jgi:hypothetical protein